MFFDQHEVSGSEDAMPSVTARSPDEGPPIWKWGIGGGGTALLATGVILIAIHNPGVDCFELTMNPGDRGTTCEDDLPARILESPSNTALPGIILAAGGAVAAAAGILLLTVFEGQDDDGAGTTPLEPVPLPSVGFRRRAAAY